MGFICLLALFLLDDPDDLLTDTTKRPHPLAPSLTQLSAEEEKKIEKIIDQFILADTGKIIGQSAQKAIADFKGLGPDAFFELIKGFNKAAEIEHSCPALTIARKLKNQLSRSKDRQLLQYARENLGVGVKKSKYSDVTRELKWTATQQQKKLGR